MKEKKIEKVIHYFPKVGVAVIKLKGVLKIGDQIKLKRGEEEFKQTVKSMQSEHENLKTAKKGKEIGENT